MVADTLTHLFDKRLPYETATSEDIPILVELLTFRGKVPQGAITSPAISNLYMLPFDKQLKKFQKDNMVTITRYCDDIAISSRQDKVDAAEIIQKITILLLRAHLRLNKTKTKVKRYYHRMRVTGIIVNEKINIPRENWRNFRACLHHIQLTKEKPSELIMQQLRGYVEWVKTINPLRGKQFLEQYERILNMPEKPSMTITT